MVLGITCSIVSVLLTGSGKCVLTQRDTVPCDHHCSLMDMLPMSEEVNILDNPIKLPSKCSLLNRYHFSSVSVVSTLIAIS